MTTAFAALLIGVAGAALLLALVAYLWVNRTPSTKERFDEYGRVPLFGVDLTGSAPAPSTPRSSLAVTAPTVHEPVPVTSRDRFAGASIDVPAPLPDRPERDRPEPARPEAALLHGAAAQPNAAQPDAAQPDAAQPDAAQPDAAQPDAAQPDAAHLHTPRRAPRITTTPGWPVGPDALVATTPRYVPPVSPNPDDRHSPYNRLPPADQQPHHDPQLSAAASNGTNVYGDGVPGSMVEGHSLRYTTPVEGTLQFLPGRLEINSGLDTGREIRFVRVPGPNGTQVTFGRTEGPLYRHIQLRDQTVSREHARMTLLDGRWVLTNLSRTNPVAHNGRVLAWSEQQPLDDGDRVEMGEVIFSFRSR